MNKDILHSVRQGIGQDMVDNFDENGCSVLDHAATQNYLLLEIFDKLESMSLALDAMLDYNAAQWHERKTKE